jgi:threonylcarbamoyladenosine tRNA methylthiotransferase MtaB
MTRFSVITLGCKVNQYDGACIAEALVRAGLTPAAPGRARAEAPEDLIVLNTCCVTAAAMRKSRQQIRRRVRRAPGALVLITGCYADYDGARLDALLASLGVPRPRRFLAGHHGGLAATLGRVVGLLSDPPTRRAADQPPPEHPPAGPQAWAYGNDEAMRAERPARGGLRLCPSTIIRRRRCLVTPRACPSDRLGPIRHFPDHQRAFVKVQDGCDAFCPYCLLPYPPPPIWLRPIDAVVEECRLLVASGQKEIVLCGVFLGAFGRDTAVRRRWDGAPSALPELLRRVAGIEGLWRVRLSSLEPGDVTDELLEALGHARAAAHLHLPLQSGSAGVLRRMRRQYTPDDYRRTVRRARAALDEPTITTDVIVGFPGETEADFAATCEVARFAGFARIHAFPFSPVAPTAAWRQRHQAAPPAVVRRRLGELHALARRLAEDARRHVVGRVLEGLVESPGRRAGGLRRAMTGRYLPVHFDPGRARRLTGRVVRLEIVAAREDGLAGRLIGTPWADATLPP